MSKESNRNFLRYIPTITDAERREAEAVGLGYFYTSQDEEEDDFYTIANRAEAERDDEEEDYFEWLERTFGPSNLEKDISHLNKKSNRFNHMRRNVNRGKDRHTGLVAKIERNRDSKYSGSEALLNFRKKYSKSVGGVNNHQTVDKTYSYFKTKASQAEAKKSRLEIEESLKYRKHWPLVEQSETIFTVEPVSSRDHEERPEWGKPYVLKKKETSLRHEINSDMWRRSAAPRKRASNKIWA